jgi:multiple sugar transport system permease protein
VYKHLSRRRLREILQFYVCVGPALLGFLIFTAGPMVASLVYSFTRYHLVEPLQFVGLENYREMLFDDPLVWKSLRVTATYTFMGVPLRLAAQLLIAMILNRNIRGVNLFRTALYLPSIVSGVALSLLWVWMLNPEFGLVNYALRSVFGIQGPRWLYSTQWVIPGMVIMSFWGIGPGIVICLAGLQGVPRELYEAAEIDGAAAWHKTTRVTIPLMTPVLFFNFVMGLIGNFQAFTQAYVMTGGGPSNASLFYVLYLYRNAFEYSRMGFGSALAWLLFVIILGMTLLVFRSSPLWVYYESEEE